jgi:hypothetical protein
MKKPAEVERIDKLISAIETAKVSYEHDKQFGKFRLTLGDGYAPYKTRTDWVMGIEAESIILGYGIGFIHGKQEERKNA